MKRTVLLIFLMMFSGASGALAQEAPVALSAEDQFIYQSTLNKCQGGTVVSALRIAFDKELFISGLGNWLQLASGNVFAGEARIKSGGMSPSVAKIRRSPGFWLAMTDCYGYQYGELNYGNLMKQIIDMGHLSMESSSTLAGLAITTGGSKITLDAMKMFPLASRFIIATLISLNVGQTVNTLINIYDHRLSPEEVATLNRIKEQAFKEPNEAIHNVTIQAQRALEKIEQRLNDPQTPFQERERLLNKKAQITESLENLLRLRTTTN